MATNIHMAACDVEYMYLIIDKRMINRLNVEFSTYILEANVVEY